MNKKKVVIICIISVILIAIISNIIDNDLNSRTIAFIGDSLMAGYGNDDKGFEYYFAKRLDYSRFINNSKSGSTITTNTGSDNIVILNQVKSLTGNPDIIIFNGGINDIIGYALGTLNSGLKKEIGTVNMDSKELANNNTVIDDFEKTVVELQTKFPDAKLCYVQLFLLDDITIDNITLDESKKPDIKARRDAFFGQLEQLCEKWGIHYIDVSERFIDTGTQYRQDDWIHFKEVGYQLLTPTILDRLEEMKLGIF